MLEIMSWLLYWSPVVKEILEILNENIHKYWLHFVSPISVLFVEQRRKRQACKTDSNRLSL